jgi:hypothetical protein
VPRKVGTPQQIPVSCCRNVLRAQLTPSLSRLDFGSSVGGRLDDHGTPSNHELISATLEGDGVVGRQVRNECLRIIRVKHTIESAGSQLLALNADERSAVVPLELLHDLRQWTISKDESPLSPRADVLHIDASGGAP